MSGTAQDSSEFQVAVEVLEQFLSFRIKISSKCSTTIRTEPYHLQSLWFYNRMLEVSTARKANKSLPKGGKNPRVTSEKCQNYLILFNY